MDKRQAYAKALKMGPPLLRPFQGNEQRPNADGSYSTEITTTWQMPDGSWANVPSLWMSPNGPQQFDPNDEDGIMNAVQQFEATGAQFPRYRTVDEAEAAAMARTKMGGVGAGPLYSTPSR
jgi:hypothetical protein